MGKTVLRRHQAVRGKFSQGPVLRKSWKQRGLKLGVAVVGWKTTFRN